MPSKPYDVIVIGTGTAGYTLAYACNAAGKRTAIADFQPYGGTCAMRGCQPKKYLVAAAAAVDRVKQMQTIGVRGVVSLDWAALQRSKNAFVDPVPESTENGFREAGIETLHGRARFEDQGRLRIGEELFEARAIVIATGAVPATLGIPGEELLTTSDAFLNLTALPEQIAFVGGGFISFEFAHVAAQAGCRVAILQRDNRPLKQFDPDLVAKLVKASAELGIEVKTDVDVCGVRKSGERFIVSCEPDKAIVAEVDLVVHGAGRVPNLAGLALEKGGIAYSRRGVTVNDYMQSVSNPSVYAIGDAATAPFQLATTADMEAEVAARNIVEGNHVKAVYDAVPSVVFTLPPLAAVGMSAAEALSLDMEVSVNAKDMTGWPSSKRIGQKHAAYKVLIDRQNGRILGAHILGHNADEAVNIFALAMKFGLTAADLKKMLWAYPTTVSDMKYTLR